MHDSLPSAALKAKLALFSRRRSAEPPARAALRVHRWQSARRLLCVRLDQLGDVLMSTPAIRALKQAVPGRHITLLTSSSAAQVARHLPEVDSVIRHDASWVAQPHGAAHASAERELISSLRGGNFDAAVIFTSFSQSALPAALLLHLAGVPLCLAHCRENPYELLSDWMSESEWQQPNRHEVQRQLDLVAQVGAFCADQHLSFKLLASDRERVARRLAAAGIDIDQPWLLLHPGASAASRRYPLESYAQVLRELQRRCTLPLVLGGNQQEYERVEQLRAASGVPALSLAGELSLGEYAALIAKAAVLISNNSGPVHLAAAVGTPVVDLYALTNPQHTPWQVPHRVLNQDVDCRWCYRSICSAGHHRCLAGVAPERVAATALALLEATRQPLPQIPSRLQECRPT